MTLAILILSACLSFALVNVLQWHYRLNLPKKPFGCVPCLSGWLTIPLTILSGLPLIYIPYIMAGGMITGIMLNEKLLK